MESLENALDRAIVENDLEKVKSLVDQGVNIHHRSEWPLRFACKHNCLDIVKYLVEQGADPCIDNDWPLKLSAGEGHLEIVKFLIEQGADIHAGNDRAIRWATADADNIKVVEYILSLEPRIYWITHQDKDVREIWSLIYD